MQVYEILMEVTSTVQPLSCDEAFLDVTGLGDPLQIAESLRSKIWQVKIV
jgi:DNA repair protein REV1